MKKNQWIISAVLVGLVILVIVVFWYLSPIWFENNDFPYAGHMMGGWGMPFGMIVMGIFWVAVIYFIFKGFNDRHDYREDRALEVLKTRLAKGEITLNEYETLKEKIQES